MATLLMVNKFDKLKLLTAGNKLQNAFPQIKLIPILHTAITLLIRDSNYCTLSQI